MVRRVLSIIISLWLIAPCYAGSGQAFPLESFNTASSGRDLLISIHSLLQQGYTIEGVVNALQPEYSTTHDLELLTQSVQKFMAQGYDVQRIIVELDMLASGAFDDTPQHDNEFGKTVIKVIVVGGTLLLSGWMFYHWLKSNGFMVRISVPERHRRNGVTVDMLFANLEQWVAYNNVPFDRMTPDDQADYRRLFNELRNQHQRGIHTGEDGVNFVRCARNMEEITQRYR